MRSFAVQPLNDKNRGWVKAFLEEHNHSLIVVSRGKVHDASKLPGFGALQGDTPVGLLTYRLYDDQCEIVTLHSTAEGIGVGSALIAAVREWAGEAGARRLWLITTNDNLPALKFYQKRGFVLRAVHPNAMDAVRKVKPFVPLIGLDGIPLRDEIELEIDLSPT
jgi:GNAT superfamily N-acetyltransferase